MQSVFHTICYYDKERIPPEAVEQLFRCCLLIYMASPRAYKAARGIATHRKGDDHLSRGRAINLSLPSVTRVKATLGVNVTRRETELEGLLLVELNELMTDVFASPNRDQYAVSEIIDHDEVIKRTLVLATGSDGSQASATACPDASRKPEALAGLGWSTKDQLSPDAVKATEAFLGRVAPQKFIRAHALTISEFADAATDYVLGPEGNEVMTLRLRGPPVGHDGAPAAAAAPLPDVDLEEDEDDANPAADQEQHQDEGEGMVVGDDAVPPGLAAAGIPEVRAAQPDGGPQDPPQDPADLDWGDGTSADARQKSILQSQRASTWLADRFVDNVTTLTVTAVRMTPPASVHSSGQVDAASGYHLLGTFNGGGDQTRMTGGALQLLLENCLDCLIEWAEEVKDMAENLGCSIWSLDVEPPQCNVRTAAGRCAGCAAAGRCCNHARPLYHSTDNGGENSSLTAFLRELGIFHLFDPPHSVKTAVSAATYNYVVVGGNPLMERESLLSIRDAQLSLLRGASAGVGRILQLAMKSHTPGRWDLTDLRTIEAILDEKGVDEFDRMKWHSTALLPAVTGGMLRNSEQTAQCESVAGGKHLGYSAILNLNLVSFPVYDGHFPITFIRPKPAVNLNGPAAETVVIHFPEPVVGFVDLGTARDGGRCLALSENGSLFELKGRPSATNFLLSA